MSLLPGLEIETCYLLQRNTVCLNGDLNFNFFPPFRTFFLWNLNMYALDDICLQVCVDDTLYLADNIPVDLLVEG